MRCERAVLRVVGSLLFGVLVGIAGLDAGEPPRIAVDTMAGQVVDPTGKPVAGATVWLVGGPYREDCRTLQKQTSDADGRFAFAHAAAGWESRSMRPPCLIVRDAQGRWGVESYPWISGTQLSQPRQDVKITLVAAADCRVRLIDAAGKPIGKASVRVTSVSTAPRGDQGPYGVALPAEVAGPLECHSADDGSLVLRRLPAGGSVYCKVSAAGFGAPNALWDVADSVTLSLQRVGSIRGKFRAPTGEKALDSVTLYLYPLSGPEPRKPSPRQVTFHATITSATDGSFQCDDVPAGHYTITPELYRARMPYYCEATVSAEVKAGQATQLEIPLLPAVAVRGRVVEAESGRGFPGVSLFVSRVSDQRVSRVDRQATTDAEGRYVGYAKPGKVIVSISASPDGYVVPLNQGNPTPRDALHDIEWPSITLQRAARLEGIVVDDSGKPAPDAEVEILFAQAVERTAHRGLRTDPQGKFALDGLLARETLSLRARKDAATSDIRQLRPADSAGPIRVTLSPKNSFAIRGTCVDAAGRPIAQAKVAPSSAWMLGPMGIGCSARAVETDSQGRFEIRGLWSGPHYSLSVTAESFDKLEQERIESQPGQVHDAGRLTLVSIGGAVEGIVVDTAGRPIVGARVFNSGDAPRVLSTTSDAAGRFRLKGFRVGSVYVFAEKQGYRFAGAPANTQRTDVRITLFRSDEPVPPWKPQPPSLSLAEQQKTVRRLLEKLWAAPRGHNWWPIRCMARIDPQQAMKWSAEMGGQHNNMIRATVAEGAAQGDPEEVIALLAPASDREAFVSLGRLAHRAAASDPVKAARWLEEAIVRARRTDQPERTWMLADAGALAVQLGKIEAGRRLVDEAAGMASKLATDQRQGYYRGIAAAALAPHNLPAALKLVENVADNNERERALAKIAAAVAPQDLAKALEIIDKLDKRSTLPDSARLRIAYSLMPTRRDDAMRVVDGMNSYSAVKMRAEAFGWLAVAVAPTNPKFAHALIDRALAVYWDKPEEFQGWSYYGGRAGLAAPLVVQAQQVGYPDMASLIYRVLAMRSPGEEVWSRGDGGRASSITALYVALVDPQTARQVLLAAAPADMSPAGVRAVLENRELLQAWALVDLDHAAKLIEASVASAKGESVWTNSVIGALDLLTMPPDTRFYEVLRFATGHWSPREEM